MDEDEETGQKYAKHSTNWYMRMFCQHNYNQKEFRHFGMFGYDLWHNYVGKRDEHVNYC